MPDAIHQLYKTLRTLANCMTIIAFAAYLIGAASAVLIGYAAWTTWHDHNLLSSDSIRFNQYDLCGIYAGVVLHGLGELLLAIRDTAINSFGK